MCSSDLLVAEAIGANVPAVARTGERQVAVEFVPGDPGAKRIIAMKAAAGTVWDPPPAGGDDVPGLTDSDAGHLLGVLDILVSNPDRHGFNWIVNDNDEPVGIDLSGAWSFTRYRSESGNTKGRDVLLGPSSPFSKPLLRQNQYNEILGYRPNRLTKADVALLRKRLEALKPKFAAVDENRSVVEIEQGVPPALDRDLKPRYRGDRGEPEPWGELWHREMMLQLDELEHQAKGKRNLIASNE